MRQPTIYARKRRLTRQKRLVRTGTVFVLLVIFIAVVVSLFSGSEKKFPLAHVAFRAGAHSASDGAHTAKKTDARAEAGKIVTLLNGWYQSTYVDTDHFGDGTFPEVAKLFVPGSQRSFQRDLPSLSIGDLRKEAVRIVPVTQNAVVTVYFVKGKTPQFAVAVVDFEARVTLKDSAQLPVMIQQHATYHLTQTDGSWMVTYYTVKQDENSIQPQPSGSPS